MFLQLVFASALALTVSATDTSEAIDRIANPAKTPGVNEISCYLISKRISGTNKICTYNCGPSEAVTTIKSHELCPQRINR